MKNLPIMFNLSEVKIFKHCVPIHTIYITCDKTVGEQIEAVCQISMEDVDYMDYTIDGYWLCLEIYLKSSPLDD